MAFKAASHDTQFGCHLFWYIVLAVFHATAQNTWEEKNYDEYFWMAYIFRIYLPMSYKDI